MNSKQDNLPRLDPGESTLPRKRLLNLQMEATVFDKATNLLPPLDPPQPPDPAQPPTEILISDRPLWIAGGCWPGKLQSEMGFAPRRNASNDPETKTREQINE